MNVLSLVHVHRLPNPSGVGRVMDQIIATHARRFPATQHRLLVQAALYKQAHAHLAPFWQTMPALTYRPHLSLQQLIWVATQFPPAESYWKEVDLVYCPAESYLPSRHAPLVCTIHDVAGFEPTLYAHTLAARIHRAKWRAMFMRIARHAAAVTTISEFSAARIRHFFPAMADKLRVIPNAAHPCFNAPPPDADRAAARHLSGGAPYVLVPGGLSLRKNGALIVQAWPELEHAFPDHRLVIAGRSRACYSAALAARNCRNVIHAGYVPDGILNALYRHAHVVWFPSRYEGFGMPPLEAMACGAPVLTSNTTAIPEVVGDAAIQCGVDDTAAHVDAITALLQSASERQRLSGTGQVQAARFSWNAAAQLLDTVFHAVL